MIAREAVETFRKQYAVTPDQLIALLDVVTEADRLTDLLGEFSFDGGACGEQSDRLDAALVRLRDVVP